MFQGNAAERQDARGQRDNRFIPGGSVKIKIGKGIGDVSEATLRFFKQIGVEDVHMPTRWNERTGSTPTVRPLVPPTQKGRAREDSPN